MDRKIDLKRKMAAQARAIDKFVWLESEKARRNLRLDDQGQPSDCYLIKWIHKEGKRFGDLWPNSLCRFCSKLNSCNEDLTDKCYMFSLDREFRIEFFLKNLFSKIKRRLKW